MVTPTPANLLSKIIWQLNQDINRLICCVLICVCVLFMFSKGSGTGVESVAAVESIEIMTEVDERGSPHPDMT